MASGTKKTSPRYRIAPGPDIDLDREEVSDVRGNRITAAYVEEAVARGHQHFETVGRAVGRPSMSAPGTTSPAMGVRLPAELKAAVEARAKREGRKPAALVREAITEYMKR